MIDNNIDIYDARYNTNAPFTRECTLTVNGVSIPADMFMCVKLYCTEDNVLPCSIRRISVSRQQRDTVEIVFMDFNDTSIGTWWLHRPENMSVSYVLSFICDDTRALRGYVAYSPELFGLMYAAASASEDGATMVSDDFRLLPMCCIPYFRGSMRSITAADRTTCANVALYPGIYTRAYWSGSTYSVGVVDKLKVADGTNGICRMTVTLKDESGDEHTPGGIPEDGIWVGGVDMLMKHSPVSNIRVLTKNSKISLNGVLDVGDEDKH